MGTAPTASLIVDFSSFKLSEITCHLSCQFMGNMLQKSKINKMYSAQCIFIKFRSAMVLHLFFYLLSMTTSRIYTTHSHHSHSPQFFTAPSTPLLLHKFLIQCDPPGLIRAVCVILEFRVVFWSCWVPQ